MTDTDIRVQLAKKLGWEYSEIGGFWIDRDTARVAAEPLCLYDLCLEGEERLTEEQHSWYNRKILARRGKIFDAIRLSNLPERGKALCEVLP